MRLALVLLAGCDRLFGVPAFQHQHAPVDAASDSKAAPPMHVQEMSRGVTPSGASVSVTLATTPTPQHVLIVIGGATSGTLTLTGGGVVAWELAASSNVSATDQIWYGVTDGSSSSIMLSTTSPSPIWADLSEWSGLDASGSFDGMDANGASGGPPSSGEIMLSVMTSRAPDLLVFSAAGFGVVNNPVGTWMPFQPTMAGAVAQHAWYQITAAAGAQSIQASYTNDWDAVAGAFHQ